MDPESLTALQPFDEHNLRLANQVHPSEWQNPEPQSNYHLVVIGAGTAGLVTAAGAAGLGARVALIERELMGGDCLNVGCVPSKGMIRAGRAAHAVQQAPEFGVNIADRQVDFAAVMQRMRRLRADISPADSAARFAGLGVDVFFGQGSFLDAQRVQVNRRHGQPQVLSFRKAVIATGARAAVPLIPGIESVAYLTNESLFSLTECPRRLAVIGSGPIGCEMAQTFARLGSEVHLLDRAERIMPRADPQAADVIQRQFRHEGIHLHLGCRDLSVEQTPKGTIRLRGENGDGRKGDTQASGDQDRASADDGTRIAVEVDQLLVATGRAANVEELQLSAAGVAVERQGIRVNEFLQTTAPNIYAAGDVCSPHKFTHAADFQARIVIQNSLFALGPLGRKSTRSLLIPWATYTSPEVAHVGLDQQQAKQTGQPIDVYVQPLADVDRAMLDGQDTGFVKVITARGSGQIKGATIVAENAGDMISELTLAIQQGVGLGEIASCIHPYPTQADAIRKIGDQFKRTQLTPRNRWILDSLRRWNVGK